jgi:hypothetical protein
MGRIGSKEEDIMQDLQPSFQEWHSLYRAAIDFCQIQPWQWVNDTDLFGVKYLEDGEIGYCCVVGALGEFLGLVVYLGTEGLESYLKTQMSESPEDDVLSTGKCLVASFEDRKSLQKPDQEVIKRLGLKFRGPKSWPLFRSYEPGYYPWYLNQPQVRFLIHALRQAADVSLQIKLNRNLLTNSEKGRFLVRVAEQSGSDLHWKDEWLPPAPLERAKYEAPIPDELRLLRIKRKNGLRQAGIWEIDFYHIPIPIQEGNRPFIPLCLLIVDNASGFVLKGHLESRDRHGPEFQNQMLNVIEEMALLPLEIWVKREEVFQLFEPLVSRLGLKMKQVKRLKMLEHAQNSMDSYFLSGKMPQ